MNLKHYKIILFFTLLLAGASMIVQLLLIHLIDPESLARKGGTVGIVGPIIILWLIVFSLCLCGGIGVYFIVFKNREKSIANETVYRGRNIDPHKSVLITITLIGGAITLVGSMMRDISGTNNPIKNEGWSALSAVLIMIGLALCLCGALGVFVANIKHRE